MLHFFDPEIAVQYGVNEAIFIQNLRYWIQFNRLQKRHQFENRHWTYNSQRAFAELFPYWTPRQIRHIVDKLRAEGAIDVACWNEDKTDRTQWYTLREDLLLKEPVPKQAKPSDKNGMFQSTTSSHGMDKFVPSHIYTDVNTDVCIGADAPKRADALTHTEPSRSKKPEDAKKTTLTVKDLVAEGVAEQYARDWIKARGKKTLTPTAWAKLKTDAAKHGGTPAQAVKICAENGWQGLNHDGAGRAFAEYKATQNRPQQWQPEDPNKICVSPTGEKWFMGRRVI